MQDYKFVLRTLTGGATVLNDRGEVIYQNAGEFASYLTDTYLSQGYTVLSVNLNRVVTPPEPNPSGLPAMYEYTYHLVKEVTPKSAK